MTIGIVGLGLIGGSLALDLLDRGRDLVGFDTDAGHMAGAAAAGVRGAASIDDLATSAGLVVVAVPPREVAVTVEQVTAANASATVTDVASVKASAALGLPQTLPARYVGGHPMAGTERSGWAAARRGLLAGAAWLLTPHDDVDLDAFADVAELVLDLQARPVVVDMQTHDLLVAAVSHVPHMLAYGLHAAASASAGEAVDLIAGPSFRDATRVAASDPAFWAEVVDRNRTAIREVVGRMQAWLDGAIETDGAGLTALLTDARREVTAGGVSDQTVSLRVEDPAPGLVDLRALGAAGHVITALERGGSTIEVTMVRR